ncbi:MAG: MarC family protein [Bacteroidetes bacterium]|nr:MarC family protein [Bacteroidota bacterium]
MEIKIFLSAFLAFLALVNPIQKLFVVFSLQENYTPSELKKIVTKSTITALGILILFLFLGIFILNYIFNLEIYAFQVTCGVVLFYNGFMGLQKGAFLTIDKDTSVEDIIAVPIAVPMIAGPATITAVVTMPSIYGQLTTFLAMTLAILVNYLIMLNAHRIGEILVKKNIMMPMIRITGLIVAAIGSQMVFNGIHTFISNFTTI